MKINSKSEGTGRDRPKVLQWWSQWILWFPVTREWFLEVKISECPYLLIEECLYSMCGTVICLVTVPIVEESGGFGGNCHGSYLNCISVPQQLMKNLVHSSSTQWTHPSFIKDRWGYHRRLSLYFSIFPVEFVHPKNYEDGQVSHGTLSVHRRTRLSRTPGMINWYIWLVLIGLSIDEPYGRV